MIDIAIVLNGEIRDQEGISYLLRNAQYIIAVDGGFNHLVQLNIKPNLIIGDLDSVNPEYMPILNEWNIPIEKYNREKDETDSEIAIKYCQRFTENAKDKILIGLLAAFGSRFDHVLSNQFLAETYANHFDFILSNGEQNQLIIENQSAEQRRYVTFKDAYFRKFNKHDMVFTVLSMSPRTENVSINNAKYELNNVQLKYGDSLGISNEPVNRNNFYDSDVSISFGQGCLSIFLLPEE